MKSHWFHLMPYKYLPEDFQQKHKSVWGDVPEGHSWGAISDTAPVGTHANARGARCLCSSSHHLFEYINDNAKGGFCND
jgi:hypothetical protein